MSKRKLDSELTGPDRPKRPKRGGGVGSGEHGAVVDVSMEGEHDINPFNHRSPGLPTYEQQYQFSSGMVCDAETGGQNQPLDNRQAISAGFPSQERGAPPLLSPGENDAKASVSEVRALAAVLRSEHAELEKKLDANLEAVMLKVALRIKSIENTVMQRSEGELPQTLNLGPAPVDAGDESFKFFVRSYANKLLYPRTRLLSPLNLDVPSISEVLDFVKGPHVGPTIARFRIDPASRPNSPWNLQACRIFAEDFCARQCQGSEGKTPTDVSWAFYLLIPEFTTQHALASGFADVPSYERFQESLRRHIRRHRLAQSRLVLVNEVHELRGFLPVIRHLVEEDGMSSDEQDADDILDLHSSRPFWRHSFITDWLHSIDSVGANHDTSSTAQNGYRRRRSSKVDGESRVVKGLPINFYDWEYLGGLDKSQYSDLDPKPALSLEFSDSVQRILCEPHP